MLFSQKNDFFSHKSGGNLGFCEIFCTFVVHFRIMPLSCVIGILNITPDSFAQSGEKMDVSSVVQKAVSMVEQGAYGLDIGAVATHPGAALVSAQEEWNRLSEVLPAIRRALPTTPLSVDTYRACVAERAIEAGVEVINDISGGQWDEQLWDVVAKAKVGYVLGHTLGTVAEPTKMGNYADLMSDMIDYFVRRLDKLHRKGVSNVIIDPGFGFSKTAEQNLYLLEHLQYLHCLDTPIMVGISRKRMIYVPLGVKPTSPQALEATLQAERVALQKGATFLRVHDVLETVKLC